MKKQFLCSIGIIAVMLISSSSVCLAQEMAVPVFVQAKWMSKIFEYVKSLQGKAIKVAVVHGDEFEEAEDFVAALKSNKMDAFATKNAGSVSDANVVYMAPGAKSSDAARLANKLGALSVTGVNKFFDAGNASIGILASGEKIQVMFNSDQIKNERVEVSPDLMRVAKKK
jgi:NADPH-dependent glutamate synthase beta subunit-like oxidoreductase